MKKQGPLASEQSTLMDLRSRVNSRVAFFCTFEVQYFAVVTGCTLPDILNDWYCMCSVLKTGTYVEQ